MKAGWKGWSTRCVHAGQPAASREAGACTPLHVSTAYPSGSGDNIYPRYFNVLNQEVVAAKLADLEGGEAALVLASGMAAISTTLLACLNPGDHALFQHDLYGGTHQLVVRELMRWGVQVSWVRDVAEAAAALRPETRLLYLETPGNPLLRCVDLAAAAALTCAQNLLLVVDNTFATPVNQNPLALGADIVVHSATKYLNGHSDVSAGVVIASAELVQRVRAVAMNHGGVLDARACAQLERGLKTLALRMERHNANALRLARFLQAHPAVARVHYPGLPDSPDHALACRQMRGFGGMLSFELCRPERVDDFLGGLRLALAALSLGGVESLVCVPARTSHLNLTAEERAAAGIAEGLVRVSVGIEDAADLERDFAAALEAA
jgi:cystathionine beta-lyase/cystathionine gamma-synthase